MSAPYPDGPAVTLHIDRGYLHYTITITAASLGWVSSRDESYTLMIDSAAYPLAPLSARTDDPAAWARKRRWEMYVHWHRL